MCYGQMLGKSMPAEGSKRCERCDNIVEPGENLTERRQWWGLGSADGSNDTVTWICDTCVDDNSLYDGL